MLKNVKELSEAALHLPIEQRAQLAHSLLLTLDDFTGAEIADEWRKESARRAADLDEGVSTPVSAEQVSALAKSLLK